SKQMGSAECLSYIYPKNNFGMKKKINPSDLSLQTKQVGQSSKSTKDGVTTSFEVCDLSRLCNETMTCDETSRNCATAAICATKNCADTNKCPISASECNTYMGDCNQTGNNCLDTDAHCQVYTEQVDCVTDTCAIISQACLVTNGICENKTVTDCEVSKDCQTDETLIRTKCMCVEG
ncbi:MAG: hypothetical protein K2G79_01280, partial [Muribaculum sp.]|nr:hypothetical protein [Muribaculum sp.]